MSAHEKAVYKLNTCKTAQNTTHPDFTAEIKATATLIAQFAIAGHVVHKGSIGDFTICKYAMARYCKDFAELQVFAKQVGVK